MRYQNDKYQGRRSQYVNKWMRYYQVQYLSLQTAQDVGLHGQLASRQRTRRLVSVLQELEECLQMLLAHTPMYFQLTRLGESSA